jgi:hypothetical protein
MGICGAETEVYSRVVGYFRPVKQWNIGKKAEFFNRKTFDAQSTIEVKGEQDGRTDGEPGTGNV